MDARSSLDTALPPLMRAGGELSPAAVAALAEHPQFAAAMRALLAANVELYRGNRVLNYVGYDRGRLVVGILALYLHVTRDPADPTSGLTAQRLKALCVEQDVCSAGRARAMLSLLHLFGYLAAAPGTDGRYKLLAPTDRLLTYLRERWGAMLSALALVLPEGAAAHAALASEASGQRGHSISARAGHSPEEGSSARAALASEASGQRGHSISARAGHSPEEGSSARAALARDDFLAALVRRMIEDYRSGIRALALTPELAPFAEHNAGLMILSSLALAGQPDDTMPPTRPVHLSISELARRFSVSRAHVLRLLRAAAAQGLIERSTDAGEAVTLTPPLARALTHGVAVLFLFFARCARAALAETSGRLSAR
jgi:hypothetical protein